MILCFRGSDCRRSSSSTWYNRMDRLLMALGFTESKAVPNLCFKVEGKIPVMLLLYVDDLFLIEKVEVIKVAIRRLVSEFEIKDLGMVPSRHGGVVECEWNLPCTREVCNGDPKEVQDDILQGHGHTYGIKPKYIE